jgi:hypothetical protein
LLLLCGVLAQNEGWHRWLHPHEEVGGIGSCAVCLVASGGLDVSAGTVSIVPVHAGRVVVFSLSPAPLSFLEFRQDFQSRGPPASGA